MAQHRAESRTNRLLLDTVGDGSYIRGCRNGGHVQQAFVASGYSPCAPDHLPSSPSDEQRLDLACWGRHGHMDGGRLPVRSNSRPLWR